MTKEEKNQLIEFVKLQKDKGRDTTMIADMIYFEYKTESYQKAWDITNAVLTKVLGVKVAPTSYDVEPNEERENVISPTNPNDPGPELMDTPWLLQFKTFNVGSKKPNEEMIYAQPIDAQQ